MSEQTINTYPRSAGVLMPITTLHGPFGIGVLGAEANEFIDFLSETGFHAWQVLPVESTGLCCSPYKCVSAFAGEPMLIDPRMLLEMGLITTEDLEERAAGMTDSFVDYDLVKDKQMALLRKAFERFDGRSLVKTHPKPAWLDTYSLYMALKDQFDGKPWYEWPDEGLRSYNSDSLKVAKTFLSNEILFYSFVQWLFHEQWQKLKDYATGNGISIIGDMPFYVSEDSVEVWSRRTLFNADPDGCFPAVGGAPPDYFSPLGQHWGNPVYNWKLMKKNGYKWWATRVAAALERYDYVRLDHFRGFDSYWSIPSDAPDARSGSWVRGPGIELFNALETALGNDDLPLIAEDLGDMHGDVEKLLDESGLRGMRVLQFGFMGDDKHLPHNITENCVAYTGTHDNTTMLAWLYELSPSDRERALFYIGFDGDWSVGGPGSAVLKAWIRALFTSGASLAVVPIQDLLGYGADTRTNTPGTSEGNWLFRIRSGALAQIDRAYYKSLIKVSSRDNAM
ncbi:MAG: 4-alpha-glucanotransferase [Oscillospiraceae bacterium]|nr:4-alpha-glucanotransferase [Oscillospiraceae bacterium]